MCLSSFGDVLDQTTGYTWLRVQHLQKSKYSGSAQNRAPLPKFREKSSVLDGVLHARVPEGKPAMSWSRPSRGGAGAAQQRLRDVEKVVVGLLKEGMDCEDGSSQELLSFIQVCSEIQQSMTDMVDLSCGPVHHAQTAFVLSRDPHTVGVGMLSPSPFSVLYDTQGSMQQGGTSGVVLRTKIALKKRESVAFNEGSRKIVFDGLISRRIVRIRNTSQTAHGFMVQCEPHDMLVCVPSWAVVDPGETVEVAVTARPQPYRNLPSTLIPGFLRLRSLFGFPLQRIPTMVFNGPLLRVLTTRVSCAACDVGSKQGYVIVVHNHSPSPVQILASSRQQFVSAMNHARARTLAVVRDSLSRSEDGTTLEVDTDGSIRLFEDLFSSVDPFGISSDFHSTRQLLMAELRVMFLGLLPSVVSITRNRREVMETVLKFLLNNAEAMCEVSDSSVMGAMSQPFEVTPSQCCILPGEYRSLTLHFSPVEEGSFSDEIRIVTVGNETHRVGVDGYGGSALQVDVKKLEYGYMSIVGGGG